MSTPEDVTCSSASVGETLQCSASWGHALPQAVTVSDPQNLGRTDRPAVLMVFREPCLSRFVNKIAKTSEQFDLKIQTETPNQLVIWPSGWRCRTKIWVKLFLLLCLEIGKDG